MQKGQGIEKAGDELAGYIPTEGILSRSQCAPNREQIPLQVIFDALLLKDFEIGSLRPLHQPSVADKAHRPAPVERQRNEKAQRRAGFAAVQYLTDRGGISGVSRDLQGGVV